MKKSLFYCLAICLTGAAWADTPVLGISSPTAETDALGCQVPIFQKKVIMTVKGDAYRGSVGLKRTFQLIGADGEILYELTNIDAGESVKPVKGGVLGRLDLSLVRNGIYTLRMNATSGDFSGKVDVPVAVFTDKPGSFLQQALDCKLDHGGKSIKLNRTYSSLDRFGSPDLGPGWSFPLLSKEVTEFHGRNTYGLTLNVELDEVRHYMRMPFVRKVLKDGDSFKATWVSPQESVSLRPVESSRLKTKKDTISSFQLTTPSRRVRLGRAESGDIHVTQIIQNGLSVMLVRDNQNRLSQVILKDTKNPESSATRFAFISDDDTLEIKLQNNAGVNKANDDTPLATYSFTDGWLTESNKSGQWTFRYSYLKGIHSHLIGSITGGTGETRLLVFAHGSRLIQTRDERMSGPVTFVYARDMSSVTIRDTEFKYDEYGRLTSSEKELEKDLEGTVTEPTPGDLPESDLSPGPSSMR